MSTHRIPILGPNTLPDSSGAVYFEPAAVNFQANDRYPHLVAVFADTATKISLGFLFKVPKNYVGTPKIVLVWATTAITGSAVWDVDYRAIADAEDLDPSTDQESVTATSAAPGTARLRKDVSLSLTGTNLAADDVVQGKISRDGADAADTLAAAAYLVGAFFEYADA